MNNQRAPRAKRSLGQNFLVDPNIIQAIVRHCRLSPEDTVVELGVGRGDLTLVLAQAAKRVIGIEIDRDLIEWIRANRSMPPNVEIRREDMLRLSLEDLAKETGGPVKLVGNLPYNIATQLVFHLLPQLSHLDWAIFMFQKEVAERILAPPGSKTYGVISVLVSYWMKVERLMEIPPHVFRPRPKVSSTVLRLSPRKVDLPAADYRLFTLVVKAAFQQRRKKLSNALKSLPEADREAVAKAMEECGIDPSVRAERLSLEDFIRLSNKLSGLMAKNY